MVAVCVHEARDSNVDGEPLVWLVETARELNAGRLDLLSRVIIANVHMVGFFGCGHVACSTSDTAGCCSTRTWRYSERLLLRAYRVHVGLCPNSWDCITRRLAVGISQLPIAKFPVLLNRRHLRAMVALEHPLRAQLRVESSIVMQSLVRRFLARVLVCQASMHRSTRADVSRYWFEVVNQQESSNIADINWASSTGCMRHAQDGSAHEHVGPLHIFVTHAYA